MALSSLLLHFRLQPHFGRKARLSIVKEELEELGSGQQFRPSGSTAEMVMRAERMYKWEHDALVRMC